MFSYLVYEFPMTVDKILRDHEGRKAALIKALTDDFDEFYQQCDPDEKNLCLYGHPNEVWEVNFPEEEVPPSVPDPVLGINFARDGMEKEEWLNFVASHCDSWLIAMAYFLASHSQYDKLARQSLVDSILELPTVTEVVRGAAPVNNNTSGTVDRRNKSKVKLKVVSISNPATLVHPSFP